jgi:hypothetical protein
VERPTTDRPSAPRKRASVAATVRGRLLRLAHERGEELRLLLTRYAGERLLYRLSRSPHGSQFVLKGAALFTVWSGRPDRSGQNVDIGLLGLGEPSSAYVRRVFGAALAVEVPEDGVTFDDEALEVVAIPGQREGTGVRVLLSATAALAPVRLHVDVVFGDSVGPRAVAVDFPPLLDFDPPRLKVSPPETVVAESVESIVRPAQPGAWMRDFHDLVRVSRMFSFRGAALVKALRTTFARRSTPLPSDLPLVLSPAFTGQPIRIAEWAAFIAGSEVANVGNLSQAAAAVTAFVENPLVAATAQKPWTARWRAGGPWSRTPKAARLTVAR